MKLIKITGPDGLRVATGNEILSQLDLSDISMGMDAPYDFMGVDTSLTQPPQYRAGDGSPYLSIGMHAAVINKRSPQPEIPRPGPPDRGIVSTICRPRVACDLLIVL